METTNLLVSADTLQGAGVWGMYSLDLLLKSCFVLLGTLLAAYLLRKQAAVIRHLLWYTCLLILLCLPFLSAIIPPLWFNLPLGRDQMYAVLSGWGPDWLWPFVLIVYVSGVLWILLRLCLDVVRIYLLSRRARPPYPRVAQQVIAELEDNAGRAKKVQVCYSDEIAGPLSWGILRPLILMPVEALSWPAEKTRLVIAHELGHIQRWDWLSLLVLRVVCALYWFNPLIWRAAELLNKEAEKACDDVVVLEGDQTHYAQTLLEVAKGRVRQQERTMLAKAMAASFLSHRVMAILDGNVVRAQADFLYFFRAVLVAASVSVLLAGTGLSAVEGPEQRPIPRGLRLIDVDYFPEQEEPAEESLTESLTRDELMPGESIPVFRFEEVVALPEVEVYAIGDPRLEQLIPEPEMARLSLDADLRLLRASNPVYPDIARKQGIEGYSVVEYSITSEGEVANARILESSPGSMFDDASLEAVSQYRFTPLRLGGKPIGVEGFTSRFIYLLEPDPG